MILSIVLQIFKDGVSKNKTQEYAEETTFKSQEDHSGSSVIYTEMSLLAVLNDLSELHDPRFTMSRAAGNIGGPLYAYEEGCVCKL